MFGPSRSVAEETSRAIEEHAPDVLVVESAPHTKIFPEADAVVTHAGHGTVMRALAHGLPLVCLPMGRDQNDNAARVASHGVGLRLRPSAKAKQICEAVQRVLHEQEFRRRAEQMQRIIDEDVAKDRALRELEAVGLRGDLAGAKHRHDGVTEPISASGGS